MLRLEDLTKDPFSSENYGIAHTCALQCTGALGRNKILCHCLQGVYGQLGEKKIHIIQNHVEKGFMQALGLKAPMARLSFGALTKEPGICRKKKENASLLQGLRTSVTNKNGVDTISLTKVLLIGLPWWRSG